ncbi:MAG TPA: hypothetical protein VH596_07335 [Terriglobales bacterium]|jgi:hypothetical protein
MRPFLLIILAVCLPVSAFSQTIPSVRGWEHDQGANSSVPYEYQGCLTRMDGQFLLTTQSGKVFALVSGAVSLASYIGSSVNVRAFDINPGDPSSGERSVIAGEPENGPRTLDVSQISTVESQCSPPKQK